MPKTTLAADRKDKLTRTERKALTRSSLMQAALALMGEGRSFTGLGWSRKWALPCAVCCARYAKTTFRNQK